MTRKKKPEIVVGERGLSWDDDDFNLDSHGVEAPEREVFEMFAQMGEKPEAVNEEIRERYRKYLERVKKKEKGRAGKGKRSTDRACQ